MMNFDKNVKDMILASNDMGLFSGKTGACIYSYSNPDSKNSESVFNEKLGDDLVDEIFEKVGHLKNMNVTHGLSGVGLGLMYMMKKSYVAGNPDKVLKMLDDTIYRNIAFMDKSSMLDIGDLIEIIFYLCARLKYGMKKQLERYIFTELAIKLSDHVYYRKDNAFFDEVYPYTIYNKGAMFLLATCKMYELGIHCGRILKIWEEIKHRLFQHVFYTQAGRLLMLLVVSKVAVLCKDKDWIMYSSFLRDHFSWEKLVGNEYKDRQVFFTDGLAGSFLIAECYNRISYDSKIEIDYAYVYKRLFESDIWRDYGNKEMTCRNGLDGYLGIKLLLSYMMKKGGFINETYS